MNSITIALTVSTKANASVTTNGSSRTAFTATFGDLPIKCEAWGQYMADKLTAIKVNIPVLLTGELQIRDASTALSTNRIPVIVVSGVETLPALLPINNICLAGRTGRDTQLRYTESGKTVGNVSLAVRRDKETTDWFDCTLWDRQANIAADYTCKGSLIGVQGRLGFDTWTDKNTNEQRVKPVITVDKLELLGSKKDSQQMAA